VGLGTVPEGFKPEHTFNAKGLHVLPGCIDSQAHFREPGFEYKEDLESGTRGALMGGITTVFEMPNTNPSTSTAEALAYKVNRAKDRVWSNIAFYVGAADENLDSLHTLEFLPGSCGIKLFMGASTGSLLVPSDEGVARALASSTRRMAIHSEDNERLVERKGLTQVEGATAALHPVWRDVESAFKSTRRVVALAEAAKHPVHVLHITTAEEIAFLAKHKRYASVEVLPQHLTLAAPECYERLGSLAQMNPPIREQRHQDGLWWGINHGVVDVMGSDHAPHTLEEKQKPYPQSPSGLTGVQTLLPLMLHHVNAGRLSLERMVELLCHGPSRLFNLPLKGRLVVGADADLTLVDLNAKRTISNSWIESKVGWSAFDGMAIAGWPVAVFLGGQLAMQHDERVAEPLGQVLFQ
jgi:dihydroorotase